jgi:hypothetical protein
MTDLTPMVRRADNHVYAPILCVFVCAHEAHFGGDRGDCRERSGRDP